MLGFKEQGLKEGMEKGIENGVEKEKITVAKMGTAKGLDSSTIHQLTRLPVTAIESLRKEVKKP